MRVMLYALFITLLGAGGYSSLDAMFHAKQDGVEITVLSHTQNPDKQLLSIDERKITAQYFLHSLQYPMTIAIHNESNAPITISSESCTVPCVSVSHAFDALAVAVYKKVGMLLCAHSMITALTGMYISKVLGAELYAIFKKTTLQYAHKRADAAEQKILASGEHITGWLSLLPIAYVTWLYKVLRKRQQLVPFIKRTLPAVYKKVAARIAGVEYVDVDAEKLFASELAIRTHGGLSSTIAQYAQLIDWQRMASVVHTKAPLAMLALIGGIAGMCFAPYYWHELCAANRLLHKKLKKQLLSNKSILIMPGECITQLMIFPTAPVNTFNFRILGADGVTQRTNFTVQLT